MNYLPVKGFTLIEVLVALAILAIAMTAIVQTAAMSASQQAYLEDKTFANWVALNQISLRRITPNKQNNGGIVEMASRQWEWSLEERTVMNGLLINLDVKVAKEDSPDNIIVQMASVISAPITP